MSIPSNPYVPDASRGDPSWKEYDQPDMVTTMILMRKYRKALEDIVEGYDNQDISHVDYRVKVYQIAREAL